MLADGREMVGKGNPLFFFILSVAEPLERRKRHLGVHDNRLVARKIDDEIRFLKLAVLGSQADLRIVFPSSFQARDFKNSLDNELSPVALGFRIAFYGRGEVIGLGAYFIIQFLQLPDLFKQFRHSRGIILVHVVDPFAKPLELLTERREQAVELFLILIGKCFAFFLENPVGEVFEFHFHLGLRILKQLQFFLRDLAFVLQVRLEPGVESAQVIHEPRFFLEFPYLFVFLLV